MYINYKDVFMANMWMVRAGENGFLINDFKDFNIVAIGWGLGDLSGKTHDEIKQLMENENPESSKASIGLNAGQVSRFVCDFEIGDWVISYNPQTRNYLVGKISSEYYYSKKLAERYNTENVFYNHTRDVEWIGDACRDDLNETALKPLKSVMTIIYLNDSAKNNILYSMNLDKIEWTDFYIEFADKLLEYKDNRKELIDIIYRIFSNLNLKVPTLGGDVVIGDSVIPFDMDPFTVFALFNKQISAERRIDILSQIKNEFSINSELPYTFAGIPVVNNLKATFYWSGEGRNKEDVNNLWNLFEEALNFKKDDVEGFSLIYDKVLNQKGIQWNITMGLYWIRPFTFINLDANNRNTLSSDEIFSEEFKNEIKSLKEPPKAKQYLHICEECAFAINSTDKYDNFPQLSHGAYVSRNEGYDEFDEGIGDSDVKTNRYWVYSPGRGAEMWEEFYRDGIMGIAWSELGDLSKYGDKNEIRSKLKEIYKDNLKHVMDSHFIWQFANEIKEGDIIFAKKGMNEIIGRGIVESSYEYDESRGFYPNVRKVNWTHEGSWQYEKGNLPVKTLTDFTNYKEHVDYINELLGDGEIIERPVTDIYPEYLPENFLEEVYITEDEYWTLRNLLINKKNLIVQGAPGVGKTFMAKRLAYSIMGVKDTERVMMVQFHQSYSYEDFVMGYRPHKDGFELKNGSFYRFCKDAEEDSENDYFFIIDEINRGNLSKIFGELFMLIENDKRGEKNKIQLVYSDESFFIPKNVYIIGLMNTADRSLAMIDYALRRRFAFFDLKPGFDSDGFKEYQNNLEDSKFDGLIEVMKELNQEIKEDESLGEGFRIGHSYLCNLKHENVEEKLNYIVEYELIPLLKEYWFDETEKVEYWANRLRSVIDDSI